MGFDLLASIQLPTIPLVFPFRHDGASLNYKVLPDGWIEVLDLRPAKPEDDWPYASYPNVFDSFAYGLSEPIEITEDRFLWQQSIEEFGDDSVLFIVPDRLHQNLWLADSKEDSVQCVFELRLKDNSISAWTDLD